MLVGGHVLRWLTGKGWDEGFSWRPSLEMVNRKRVGLRWLIRDPDCLHVYLHVYLTVQFFRKTYSDAVVSMQSFDRIFNDCCVLINTVCSRETKG